MIAARFLEWILAFSAKSSLEIFPCLSHSTITTFNPAMTADAGLVPCADAGIKHIFR